ncbi:SGNH/GDSL hydrolase family protein [Dactylosporangium sp. CA-139066]|uniref:SGNH/GDSL hydrolase family protein n=1 Tax=Dactylosporangium sp. CA-139066 TaxID=3239930 RepID=UPI003D8D05AA
MGRLRPLAALLFALVATVLVAPAHPAGAAVASRPIRIMPLGDSITYGVGSPSSSSYRAALWNRLAVQAGYNIDFVGSQRSGALPDQDNEGHSGWRIDEIAANIDGWLATYQPDVVLLHIGTNDMNQNYQVGTAPQRLSALVDRILADRPAATVLVAKIIPALDAGIQARIDAFNAAIPGALAGKARTRLVDLSGLAPSDLNDTLHPNDTGYARMAVRWYTGLEPVLGDGRDWPLFGTAFEAGDPAQTWLDSAGASVGVGGSPAAVASVCCGARRWSVVGRVERV